MDDVLLEIVLRRLKASPLPSEAADLLLAALEGGESLTSLLGGQPVQRGAADSPGPALPRPPGVYLRSLTVGGFRGIGAPATLNLAPAAGLILVIGRNGSGKSSFAEGLEVLLTGDLKRWQKLSAVWRQGWRSIHRPDQTLITAEFLIEETGSATVQRSWAPSEAFSESEVSVQVDGEQPMSLERLGWHQALTDYRPFLSHSELEAFFGSPSGLYELLASVLGLDDLTSAATALAAARKAREAALKEVRARLADLLGRLESAADERAATCRRALEGPAWDLGAARAAATNARPVADGGDLDRLRRAAQLTPPPHDEVRAAVAALRSAADGLHAVAGSPAGRARALAGLLTAALQHHRTHGDGGCPVCGQPGALNAQWQSATEHELARLDQEAETADSAGRAAAEAVRLATAVMSPAPPVLRDALPSGIDVRPAQAAWQSWTRPAQGGLPTDATALQAVAVHLSQELPGLTREIQALSAGASAELADRDDRWAPVAVDVTSWCADAAAARDGMAPVAAIKAAEKWLKDATNDIRNDRLAPLTRQSRSIWTLLRQESNVGLDDIRLAGSTTQRHVRMDVSVDGSPGSALGVMSQGEVNALALSVFLPRATMPASPFRFLVIDDPVQAMDPAKVNGLAQVLHKTAAIRQVIVFTHDNRLPQAIRQLNIPATILEVTRRPGSAVDVRTSMDPVEQALRDARALAADRSVPTEVAARVVPGLCRTAVEAALTEAVWRRQLLAGLGHADIETNLEEASTRLTALAALALTGDAARGRDVLPRLNSWGRRFADTFQALNRGAHGAHDGGLGPLVGDTRKLADKIRTSLP